MLVEGRAVRLWNVNASSVKSSQFYSTSQLQLCASRQTRFQSMGVGSETALAAYQPRECVTIGRVGRGGKEGVWGGEMDTVGVVIDVISTQVTLHGASSEK